MTPISRYLYVLAIISGILAADNRGDASAAFEFLCAIMFATVALIIEVVKEGRQ